MKKFYSRIGICLATLILLFGVGFRVVNLESKVYWVDEVATSIRVSGYSKQEVITNLLTKQKIAVQDLQNYQHITSEKTFNDTLKALVKSPEHAPLYFILLRIWGERFDSSVTAFRSLSIIFSLLAVPCLYGLCWELFRSPLVAGIAIALFAVSPFYVAYAQEARPYSLWTVIILLSGTTLLRAIRLNTRKSWLLYSLTLILGFYTSLLSFFVAIAQGIYTAIIEKMRPTLVLKNYSFSVSLAFLAFVPWFLIILHNWQTLQDNTTWMRVPMALPSMLVIWLYSLTLVFVNLPPPQFQIPLQVIGGSTVILLLLVLQGFSLGFLVRKSTQKVWLFILSLTLVPPLILIAIDWIVKGQGSTAPRYMIPCHLGLLLSVAYFLTHQIFSFQLNLRTQQNGKLLFVTLLSLCILSNFIYLNQSPQYQKTRNLHNLPIAKIINQTRSPILLTETTETLDLLSISHILEPSIEIQLQSTAKLSESLDRCQHVFLFNPSATLREQLKINPQLQLQQVYEPNRLTPDEIVLTLWRVQKVGSNCVPKTGSES